MNVSIHQMAHEPPENKKPKGTFRSLVRGNEARDCGAREAKAPPLPYSACATSGAVGSKCGERDQMGQLMILTTTLVGSDFEV